MGIEIGRYCSFYGGKYFLSSLCGGWHLFCGAVRTGQFHVLPNDGIRPFKGISKTWAKSHHQWKLLSNQLSSMYWFYFTFVVVIVPPIGAVAGWYVWFYTSKVTTSVNRLPGPKPLPFIGNAWDLLGGFEGNQKFTDILIILIKYLFDFERNFGYFCW